MAQAIAQGQASQKQINAAQRNVVLSSAVQMRQVLNTSTIFPPSNPLLNITPRNIGLLKRFIVEISGTINNSGTVPVDLTDSGLANVLSGVGFTDLNNYQRIQTTGLHLTLLANSKRKGPYGGTYDTNAVNGQSRSQVLNVPPAAWPVFSAPQEIAAGAQGTFRVVYEIPLAYSDTDLRGATYMNVINATSQLSLTLNQNPIAAAGDSTFAVYAGAAGAAGQISQATVTVYQEYLDQLPVAQGQVILPTLDLSTVYELKTTNFSAITPGQDFSIPFSNFRDFLSTFVVFNNNGGADGRKFGSDVNTWALQAANLTNLFKIDPLLAAQMARDENTNDLPAGFYYFPFRNRPISTTQYGNIQLVLNAIVAAPGAYANVMWEDFGLLNTLVGSSSLAS